MVDALGKQIKAGDRLAYAVRQGSNMELKFITVTNADEERVSGHNPAEVGGRTRVLKQSKTMVVIG